MQNSIENSDQTLTRLLQQVQDQAARSQDFLAPTNQLQLVTGDKGDGSKVSQIIMEQAGVHPPKFCPLMMWRLIRSASGPVLMSGLPAAFSRIIPLNSMA